MHNMGSALIQDDIKQYSKSDNMGSALINDDIEQYVNKVTTWALHLSKSKYIQTDTLNDAKTKFGNHVFSNNAAQKISKQY